MRKAFIALLPLGLIACASSWLDDTVALSDHLDQTYDVTEYSSAAVDLNGDGVEEHVVLVRQPSHCGTGGCTMFVLASAQEGFAEIGRSPTTFGPVRLSPEDHNGWQVLLTVERDGANNYFHTRHIYEDGSYQEQASDGRVDWDEPLDQDVLIAR
ncbi:hypothetical protein [Aurantiacibacter sediminis]|uniref:Lipoprotein n=1 Tax=Aurantiacibacter sediminis TaxID=2793064 RepID=A0ABS0N2T4_9SPHN|nr:hypothetical protein [Aurantiacibacter sediminis]MBH5322275.1 hypothetical protein [Aurantiacibacter sediminis]